MSALADRLAEIRAAALSVARDADTVEVHGLHRDESAVELGSGIVDAARAGDETVVCLRIHRHGRVATATTTDLDDIPTLVGDAVAGTRSGPAAQPPPRVPDVSAAAAGSRRRSPAETDDSPTVAGLDGIAAALRSVQDDTGLAVHATVTAVRQHTVRVDAAGVTDETARHWHTAAVAEGRRVPDLQVPWSSWTAGPILPGELREWLGRIAAWAQLPVVAPSAPVELILAPPAVHAVLSPLVVALSGPAVVSGRSFLAERLGTPVLHSAVGVVDGSSAALGPACTGLAVPAVDDEGARCRDLRLVDAGRPVGIYHTRASAAAAASRPTGHGFRGSALRRSLARPVAAVLNGVVIDVPPARAGRLDELIADCRDAILVESLLGTQQRAGISPIVQGRIRLGFVIRDGRVVGRMPSVPVAIDLLDVLGREFADVSVERWPVSRTWTGALPFVRSRADAA